MFLGHLLLTSIIVLGACITNSYPMLADIPVLPATETTVIQGTAYYKLHTHARCMKYLNNYEFFQDSKECMASNPLAHAQDTLVLTYHNQCDQIIAIVDVTNLTNSGNVLYQYAKNRLDKMLKPCAFKATIYTDSSHVRMIDFYDQTNNKIFSFSYDGPVTIESLAVFKDHVDLNTLNSLEDSHGEDSHKTNDCGCI